MKRLSNETQVQLALRAMQQDANLSTRRAAAIYRVTQRALRRRHDKIPRRDCTPNTMKLTNTETEVIVQHVLKLDERGYPPRLSDAEGMANSLLAERDQLPYGHLGMGF